MIPQKITNVYSHTHIRTCTHACTYVHGPPTHPHTSPSPPAHTRRAWPPTPGKHLGLAQPETLLFSVAWAPATSPSTRAPLITTEAEDANWRLPQCWCLRRTPQVRPNVPDPSGTPPCAGPLRYAPMCLIECATSCVHRCSGEAAPTPCPRPLPLPLLLPLSPVCPRPCPCPAPAFALCPLCAPVPAPALPLSPV